MHIPKHEQRFWNGIINAIATILKILMSSKKHSALQVLLATTE
jgi:hypothetical protein